MGRFCRARFRAGIRMCHGLAGQSDLANDLEHGGVQCAGCGDDLLDSAGKQVKLSVPAAHLISLELGGLRPGRVAPHDFIEWHVKVVKAGYAQVVVVQGVEYRPVGRGAENSVDDHVEAVAECVAGYRVDEADIRPARDITLAQHDPAKVVLADQGDATAVPGAYFRRHRTLARPGVAAQDDQARRFAANLHPAHASGGRRGHAGGALRPPRASPGTGPFTRMSLSTAGSGAPARATVFDHAFVTTRHSAQVRSCAYLHAPREQGPT